MGFHQPKMSIISKSIPTLYKQKTITKGCDRFIESFVCEIDRSQSRHMFCWCGSGSGSPARTHDHLYIPIKNTPTITCRAIYPVTKSATYMSSMSIGRVYVQPGAKIAVSDFTVKGGLGVLPSGVMMFFFTASATVSERSTWFTACSKCYELMRFTPLRKIEIMALLNLDTVA